MPPFLFWHSNFRPVFFKENVVKKTKIFSLVAISIVIILGSVYTYVASQVGHRLEMGLKSIQQQYPAFQYHRGIFSTEIILNRPISNMIDIYRINGRIWHLGGDFSGVYTKVNAKINAILPTFHQDSLYQAEFKLYFSGLGLTQKDVNFIHKEMECLTKGCNTLKLPKIPTYLLLKVLKGSEMHLSGGNKTYHITLHLTQTFSNDNINTNLNGNIDLPELFINKNGNASILNGLNIKIDGQGEAKFNPQNATFTIPKFNYHTQLKMAKIALFLQNEETYIARNIAMETTSNLDKNNLSGYTKINAIADFTNKWQKTANIANIAYKDNTNVDINFTTKDGEEINPAELTLRILSQNNPHFSLQNFVKHINAYGKANYELVLSNEKGESKAIAEIVLDKTMQDNEKYSIATWRDTLKNKLHANVDLFLHIPQIEMMVTNGLPFSLRPIQPHIMLGTLMLGVRKKLLIPQDSRKDLISKIEVKNGQVSVNGNIIYDNSPPLVPSPK